MIIIEDDLTGKAIRALLKAHFDHMHAVTPAGSAHVLDIESLQSPDITFWSIWDAETLAGCGALKALDGRSGEVKSMRTVASYRRMGVASQMLSHIVTVANQRGYESLCLETGSFPAFQAARAFYAKHGFTYRSPFAGYTDDPNSVFMTKRLIS